MLDDLALCKRLGKVKKNGLRVSSSRAPVADLARCSAHALKDRKGRGTNTSCPAAWNTKSASANEKTVRTHKAIFSSVAPMAIAMSRGVAGASKRK
mmetsp:Transcript_99391/g.276689  ORF Transcript_99391/g.276689 Transcript_99391/m.276689 type:complete len:96 (-) Transcript_99391:120-407(-)